MNNKKLREILEHLKEEPDMDNVLTVQGIVAILEALLDEGEKE